MRVQNPNIENIERIATALGTLRNEVILVGGCACGLLLSDKAAPPARVTYDVDLVAQVIGLASYHQLEQQFLSSALSATQYPQMHRFVVGC